MDAAKELACAQTLDANAAANVAWLHGLRLIDLEYYWEAHEILETVWMNAAPNSRERQLVQGIIHLANAALKVKMDRPKAAARLLELARNHIDEAFINHRGGDGGGGGNGGDCNGRDQRLMLVNYDKLQASLSLGHDRAALITNMHYNSLNCRNQ